jgi:hypothetical protein
LLLTTGFMRRYLDLHEELIDSVERELAATRASSHGVVAAAD